MPLLVDQVPQFVVDFIWIPAGGTVVGDVGSLPTVSLAAAMLYLVGGTLFGIAMVRGRVLARWAALLLAAGTAVTVVAAVIPHSTARALAIPVGVALGGLGYSLIRVPQSSAVRAASAPLSPPLDPAEAR